MSPPDRAPGQGRWTPYLLVAPSLLFFAVFFIAPVGYNLYLSTLEWDMLSPQVPVGLDNYERLFASEAFHDVLKATLLYSVTTTVASLGLGLFLAVALNRRGRLSGFLQGCIFSSYIVSWVGVSLLWLWLLDPTSGAVNRVLGVFGAGSEDWLGDPSLALWTLVGVSVWKTVGYDMVVYLAGLQAIPRELLEAAELDGASPWQRFRRVVWPLLRPTTGFLVITSMIMAFQAFDIVSVMTGGGPGRTTSIYVFYVWEQAFELFRTGYAAAAITVFFALILALTLLQYRWLGRKNATGERL